MDRHKLVDSTTSDTVQENAYDGLRRRTVQQSYTAGTLSETRHYFYSASWQILEERVDASSNAERQFVWGLRYIDNLILRDRDTNGDGSLDERLYALQDPNWNILAVAGATGVVQERYSYAAYGKATFLTSAYGNLPSSSYEWERLYAGYRIDHATGIYCVRARFFNCAVGSWLQRDPHLHLFSRPPGSGQDSFYSYGGLNPIVSTDPSGQVALIPPTVIPYTGQCCDWDKWASCMIGYLNPRSVNTSLWACSAICRACLVAPTHVTCAPCAACAGVFAAFCLGLACKPAKRVPCTFTGRYNFGSGYFFPFRPGIKCHYNCPDGTKQTVVTAVLITPGTRSCPYKPKTNCRRETPYVYMC